jgi:phage host-nuclease inhibitor protein Gam
MKKVNFKLMAVLAMFAIVAISAQAQTTPEAIIGQCPDLPSVAHLAAPSDNQAAFAALDAFRGKIAALREKKKKTGDRISAGTRESAISDTERIVRQTTGRSVTEIQNMSEAEKQAMGQQLAQKQLAAAGMGNMSMEQLQALAGKSDDEIAAAMTAGGMTVGGLTPEELKAMEKMTDAQRAAYMQQGDRMQRMQAAAPTAQQQRNARTQARNAQSQANASADLKRITDRWQEIDRLNEKETREVAAKCAEISAKYDPQIAAIVSKGYFDGLTTYTAEETKAAGKRVAALRQACNTESYTLWRNQVAKMQGRIKTKMADVARYDELMAQSLSSGGMTSTAKAMPSIGFEIAGQYLDVASSVTSLPEN